MKRLIIACVAAALAAGCGSAPAQAAVSSSDLSPAFRVQNGQLEYKDETGNWMAVAKQETLDSALAELQSEINSGKTENAERAPVNTPASSTKTIVIQGQKGEQGPAGQNGAAGAKGADGKDGMNGTVVTIGSDGELIINGSGTGYYLVKKGQPSDSSPVPMTTPVPTSSMTPEPVPTPITTPSSQTEYDLAVRRENGFVVITWDDSYHNHSTVTITGDAARTYNAYSGRLSVSEDIFTNGQTYTIRVEDSFGKGETSYTFRNDSVELTAPQNLKYQTGDDGSLTISWDAVNQAESYNVMMGGWKKTVTTNMVTFPKVENGRYTAYVTADSSDPAYTLSQPSSIGIYQQSISGKIDLAKPQNIYGSYDSSTGVITLSWDPVNHADYYNVTVQEMDTGPSYIVESSSISIKIPSYDHNWHFIISACANDSSKYVSSSAAYQLENAFVTPEATQGSDYGESEG